MKTLSFAVALLLLCGASPASDPDDLVTLTDWMTGSFSSAAQAARDDAFCDIRLEMWPVWTDRDDGRWIYVEQAVAGREGAPYRQRVYRVRALDDGRFVGSTGASSCPSDLRGARYATSEVRIDAGGMDSWDRGFDAEGVQVWGAEAGAYEFRREVD